VAIVCRTSTGGNPDGGEAERGVGDEGRELGGDVLGVDGVVDDAVAWPRRFNILFLKCSNLAGEIPGGPLSPPRQAHIFKPRSVLTINLDSE
jgi:hypothetical protein